jgi:iron(III) transport system ATP-binding protein
MKAPLLTCKNITKHYAEEIIFHDLSLSIPLGEILSLVGPSGCGKTTLLRCIAGLEELTEGQLWMGSEDVTKHKAEQRPIVMMFQQPLLFPHMTVIENITYGLKTKKVNKKERRTAGLTMLEKIEMEGYEDRYPYELSGGEQQRVTLARALIRKPRLLLLDEPFSSLDPELRGMMRSWIRKKLKDEAITALFVTHDKEEAMIMGDQLAVMKEGMIQQVGHPLDVYQKPINSIVAEFFSDGLVFNDDTFIPVDRLDVKPYISDGVQEKVATKEEGAQGTCYEGQITGMFIRHGQLFYQIEMSELHKKVTLPAKTTFQLNGRVHVLIKEETDQQRGDAYERKSQSF